MMTMMALATTMMLIVLRYDFIDPDLGNGRGITAASGSTSSIVVMVMVMLLTTPSSGVGREVSRGNMLLD